jgi:hypothetical protein
MNYAFGLESNLSFMNLTLNPEPDNLSSYKMTTFAGKLLRIDLSASTYGEEETPD